MLIEHNVANFSMNVLCIKLWARIDLYKTSITVPNPSNEKCNDIKLLIHTLYRIDIRSFYIIYITH